MSYDHVRRRQLTKAARHAKIITLLEQREVRSQSELAELLAGTEYRSPRARCLAILSK